MPTAHFEVHTTLTANGAPTGFYKKARHSGNPLGLPLIFCDHLHPNIESARACHYFDKDGPEKDFTPLFGNIY